MNLIATIDKIVSYTAYITDPEEIIIFGSMVNGAANVYSDIDLLIITESGINKREAVAKIKNYSHQISLKTDVLIYTRSAFEKEISIPDSFVKAAYKSGKIIFKKY